MEDRVRELARVNLGIDSKPRGCDLVALKVRDICHGEQVAARLPAPLSPKTTVGLSAGTQRQHATTQHHVRCARRRMPRHRL